MPELSVETTAIPGLLIVHLPLHGDQRGWLKENWQRGKMTALGLPDFRPVQQTMSLNRSVGVTRGLHAEPWDKYVSVGSGAVFAAWVDLRDRDSFGTSVHLTLTPDKAVFVPRGVANSFQTLEPDTVYSYLVTDHWSPDALKSYTYLNLADETVNIPWPIALDAAELSEADRHHPRLADVTPMSDKETVILGAGGQLGRALAALIPGAVALEREVADLDRPETLAALPWSRIGCVINAAAYTAVDQAETPDGRRDCWRTNVIGVRHLAMLAARHGARLVHVSSDYVFDGEADSYSEDAPLAPLGVYAATKAAADEIVQTVPNHLIVRTSWVVGDGGNFVRTMARLADQGKTVSVVDDQRGRLTFAEDLAAAIVHLNAADLTGVYNVTNSGDAMTWCDIAREVFRLRPRNDGTVVGVSTEDYSAGKAVAPRPRNSVLRLEKLAAAGFVPVVAAERLSAYVRDLAQA